MTGVQTCSLPLSELVQRARAVRIEEAWRVLETDRSRSLHELLSSARAPDVRVPLERELANMEAQLEVLESSSAEPAGDDVQERTLELTKRILALRGRLALEEIGQVESPRALHDGENGRAHVRTPVTGKNLVCRLLPETKKET